MSVLIGGEIFRYYKEKNNVSEMKKIVMSHGIGGKSGHGRYKTAAISYKRKFFIGFSLQEYTVETVILLVFCTVCPTVLQVKGAAAIPEFLLCPMILGSKTEKILPDIVMSHIIGGKNAGMQYMSFVIAVKNMIFCK